LKQKRFESKIVGAMHRQYIKGERFVEHLLSTNQDV